MKKNLILAIPIFIFQFGISQDKITKTDGKIIDCKVLSFEGGRFKIDLGLDDPAFLDASKVEKIEFGKNNSGGKGDVMTEGAVPDDCEKNGTGKAAFRNMTEFEMTITIAGSGGFGIGNLTLPPDKKTYYYYGLKSGSYNWSWANSNISQLKNGSFYVAKCKNSAVIEIK